MLERVLRFGVHQFFAATRRGQPALAAVGAFVVIVSWLRRRSNAERMIFAEDLAEGQSLQVTFRRGASVVDSATIEG